MCESAKQRVLLLLRLFWSFFRIGPATFWGGYAMIPLIEREAVTRRGWMDEAELGDVLSLAGSAPGGVGVNASAFIGYRMAGVSGAVFAILGITLPTFLIVLLLHFGYTAFADSPKVVAALKGIHGAIIALIIVSAYRMAKTSVFDRSTVVVAAAALSALLFTGINPIFVIAGGIAAGLALVGIKRRLGMSVRTEKSVPSQDKRDLIYPEYYI